MPKFFMTPSNRFGEPNVFYYVAYDNGKTQLLGERIKGRWIWADNIYTGGGIWGVEISQHQLHRDMSNLSPTEVSPPSAAISPPPSTTIRRPEPVLDYLSMADDLTGGIMGYGGLEA